MNTTTRRYPRTTLEAWPNRHPYAIERTVRPVSFVFMAFCCVVGSVLSILAALLYVGI